MTPSFTSKFTLPTFKARITDIFNYSVILRDAIYANVTAKYGNSIFHTNANYNSSADIVIGTNSFVDFDLPISDNKILNATYTIIENVQIVNEVLYKPLISSGFFEATPPISSPFTTLIAPAIPTSQGQFKQDILAIIANYTDKKVSFYNSSHVRIGQANLTGVDITSDTTLIFESITLASFATIAYWRIEGTNIYTTTNTYTYTGCPEVVGSIQAPPDCYRSQMLVQDCTKYPAGSTLARTLTARYPNDINGNPVANPVTTSNASMTLGPNIWTGCYNITLSSIVNIAQEDGLLIENTVTAALYPNVQCDAGLCALSVCINKLLTKYLSALKIGSSQLRALEIDNIVISAYLNCIRLSLDCNDTTKAATLTSQLSAYMNNDAASEGCDCGCSGVTSNDLPTEIFPLFSEPASDGRLVVYSASRAYLEMQQIYYNGQFFLVISNTTAGENPDTTRGKFKYIGGGIYTGNIGVNDTGLLTATLNKNCGIITLSAFTPIIAGDEAIIVITNSTIATDTDIEVYITNTTLGVAVIENRIITGGTITFKIRNTDDTNSLTAFKVWFNNKA